jgi:ribonuclease E
MSDETTQARSATDKDQTTSQTPSTDAASAAKPSQPRSGRRRRRGSRGGRNRRKPGARAGGTEQRETGEREPGEHDPEADRGLTTEDAAAEAREDAEVAEPAPTPPPRPRIGDTRPAPASPATAPAAAGDGNGARTGRRRRRRGGRGRGGARRNEPVRADLGVGGDAVTALEALDDDVLERRRGRTRKGRPAGRYQTCVHVSPSGATQIAVLEGRSLVEHSVSVPSDSDTSIDGNIYLGRVQNVLPGMEAAFVDFGTPKNGVLYRGDVAFDPADVEESQPRIERLLKNGQSIVVQVTKNPIGAKGARLTQEVSLAGRFVVMVPAEPDTYGISKRMPEDERRRLRRILDGIRPKDAGIIVRTAAEGATADELARDLERLQSQWQQISSLAAKSKAPRLVYQEPPLVLRLIREEFTKEYRGVVIDDRELYEEVRSYVESIAPELADRVEYYDPEVENLPLFERYHVQEQLLKALDRKVWLPSGGSLVIDRAEAFTVIDVNTGKNVGKSNLEETVFKNNIEAAEEIARQLRLRDIGGIIVIDFIDMEIKENRGELLRVFRDALARDKTRTQVFDVSELGLVEMTRKRISEGLVETFSHVCETCHGRGYLVDISLMGDIE